MVYLNIKSIGKQRQVCVHAITELPQKALSHLLMVPIYKKCRTTHWFPAEYEKTTPANKKSLQYPQSF